MASSGRKMEDTLSCAICTEVFQNPVTLPCQHSYCRECLQAFAESSSKGGDNADEPAKVYITGTNADASKVETEDLTAKDNLSPSEPDPDQPVVICCPVCRRPADLGTQGVAGLPTNFVLAEIVENFQAGRHLEESGPVCGICEEDKNIAVKACSTCSVCYCLECFTSLHPMKGVLKSHVVLSVSDYQSKQTTSKAGSGEVTQALENTPLCKQHDQALSIYCVTCKDLMCLGCIDQHNDHTASSIQKACEREKLTFMEKMKACGESKEKMDECLQELHKIIDSIKEQERRRRCQIQEEYETALKALDSWRENALQTLQDEHKKWLDDCNGMARDFQMKLQETENLLIQTKALSSGTDVGFLQEYKAVSARMSDDFQFTKKLVDDQGDLVIWCNKFLADESDPLIYLRLIAKFIQKPMLKFTKGGGSETKIKEAGAQVEEKPPTSSKIVWTNGNIQSGQHYWEYEVIINLKKDPVFYCRCYVAVGHPQSQSYQGGKTWWGMAVISKGHKFACVPYPGCDDVVPKYREWTPNPGRHNLGVYLDRENRTMTVIDCSQNQVMWTQGNIDVSKPLVPHVGFGCWDGYQPAESASFRLVPRDNKTLLPMLSEIIHGQAHR